MPATTERPRIAIPGRFSQSASALRYGAVVLPRALLEAVHLAGGEPLMLAPRPLADDDDALQLLEAFDGLVLPGGGDLDPTTYGAGSHDEVYDVDPVQDAFDIALARAARRLDLPTLAVCRGLHVLNVALGGTLVVHMDSPHRHLTHDIEVQPSPAWDGAARLDTVSCFHHQAVEQLADGLEVVARAGDGTVEAVALPASRWTVGVQWHPEDRHTTDGVNRQIFERLVRSAAAPALPLQS